MTAAAAEPLALSTECELAKKPGYKDVHELCRQTADIPLPHGRGILLQARCRCGCHRSRGRSTD
ncbi:hypothetical protein [Streptomyces hyaluromycini]|uniref:hypothetical protein n=1 Tax=Streptomyces hyaluromycini TaxID=1377993 RepID=UPI000B5CE7CB|nr:hypothetical protein [Streptomyces hyaluromycini]